jgi:hypothetical protein
VIDIYFRLFVAIISYEYKLAKSKKWHKRRPLEP